MEGTVWLSKKELQDKIIEDISDKLYSDFVVTFDRLLAHPYSYKAEDFILAYRSKPQSANLLRGIIEPTVGDDGRKYVTSRGRFWFSFSQLQQKICKIYLFIYRMSIQVGTSRCHRHFTR